MKRRQIFELALKNVDNESSVGDCQLKQFGATYGAALGWDGLQYDPYRLEMFYQMVSERLDDLLAGTVVFDDTRTFVKPEPHTPNKIDEGRVRIISAISAIDTMLDRMLYQDFMDSLVRNYSSTPVMVGWSPMYSGTVLLESKLGAGPYLNIDKSSWDWTVQPWLLEAVKELIERLAVLADDDWFAVHDARFAALFERPTFRTADGSLFFQPVGGVVKSGMYLTIVVNSLCQLILHLFLSDIMGEDIPMPVFMGDDSSQAVFEMQDVYCTLMHRLGFRVKSVVSELIEFAGVTVVEGAQFLPNYVAKNFFALMHCDDDILPESLQSLQYYYFHSEQYLRELWHVCVQTNNLSSVVDLRQLHRVVVG